MSHSLRSYGDILGQFRLPLALLEEVYKHTRDRDFEELDALLQLTSNYTRHSECRKMARIEDQVLEEVRKRLKANRNYAHAWDILRANELNMTSFDVDDARAIMARNPDLPSTSTSQSSHSG
jgi:hypothetical protein